jgi:hypothetical protein
VSRVFVSYRNADARGWASLLSDRLIATYGSDSVFLDRDTLEPGPWRQQIESALARCSVVLVVMGPHWLSSSAGDGERSLWKSDDVHRREIEIALAGSATVIPVLVDGATMPRKQDLPSSIAALAELQARFLSDTQRHRETDLSMLLSDIERADPGFKERRPSDGPPPGPWISALWLLLTTIVASIALIVTAQVALGWTFRTEEVSAVTLIVFVTLLAASRFRARIRQRTRYARN